MKIAFNQPRYFCAQQSVGVMVQRGVSFITLLSVAWLSA